MTLDRVVEHSGRNFHVYRQRGDDGPVLRVECFDLSPVYIDIDVREARRGTGYSEAYLIHKAIETLLELAAKDWRGMQGINVGVHFASH